MRSNNGSGWVQIPPPTKSETQARSEYILARRKERKARKKKQKRDEQAMLKEIPKELVHTLTRSQRRKWRLSKKKKRPEYAVYIKSYAWLQRSKQYWEKFGKACQACGSLERPVVHHMHYGSLGKEKDEHIIGLCWDCHATFHSEYKTSGDMIKETIEFVEKMKFKEIVTFL